VMCIAVVAYLLKLVRLVEMYDSGR